MNNYFPATKKVFDYVCELNKRIIIDSELIENELGIDNAKSRKALSTLSKDGVLLRVDRGKYIIWKNRENTPIKNIENIKYVLNTYLNIEVSSTKSPIEDLLLHNETKQMSNIKNIIYTFNKNKIKPSAINNLIREITMEKINFYNFTRIEHIGEIISDYFNYCSDIEKVPELINDNFNNDIYFSNKINSNNFYKLNELIYGKVSKGRFEEIMNNKYLKNAFVVIKK